ncbi:MAG: hypothetical protein A2V96_02020 [Candidatus Yonathbacteria bacterium RBG_16_43_6]|uniref:Nudix hydrolase domain-containing protein n=1 Tax=Candidatus Yonathbacteria bacterium RIFCSPLOWO2_01_FULL_43_27 TaxID=1802726 RepID=A0A1G2SE45_9BACT|nr:MAG: hypothetical protein A2V96_02020 [Candidatus Yonathbacteria bacterium RBG_16_43_6]OHA83245.1 MAG: hypothetical protein A3B07_00595 [Candidatus Yonathbacteria bacterium RIFCSPLOWO2_01_FULL_43_27]
MSKNVQRSLGAVVVIVFDPTGRMLIVREKNHPDPRWKFPGGGIEEGELPLDAAIRELREETGMTTKNLHYFTTVHERHHNRYVYCGQVLSWKGLAKEGNEGEETSVVHCHKILKMNDFVRGHHVILDKLIARSGKGSLP